MIGEWIRFGVTALCVVGGLFALLTALLGLFRFDYALNRLHPGRAVEAGAGAGDPVVYLSPVQPYAGAI